MRKTWLFAMLIVGTLGLLVIGCTIGSTGETIPPGSAWTARTLPVSDQWKSLTYGNGLFVAIAYNSDEALVSSDGITWIGTTLTTLQGWTSITYGNGQFVAICLASAAGPVSATSPAGVAWTPNGPLSGSSRWRSVAYGNGVFAAVDSINGLAMHSSDGSTWTLTGLPANVPWESVAYGNGTFVAVALAGDEAATSPDGIVWTPRTLPSSSGWSSIAYGNGRFVTLAYDGLGSTVSATSP